jgi:tRNA-2-methylthio-N6-dimethylallyladenosine synthase
MNFHIITFGCQMNVCDSDWLNRTLQGKGFNPSSEEEADFILVNTCSVREKPEQKVYSLLGRLRNYRKKNPDFFVGVGGCVAQQIGKKFWERFPHVRLVYGTDGVAMVPQAIERMLAEPELRVSLLDFLDYYPEREQVEMQGKLPAQAFVNIMQGCNNFCAYCIVPYTRGRQKSRSSEAVLEECRQLANQGVREITLLGQNVNSFGMDKYGDGLSFARLLEKVCSIPGLDRVRFTTSHPKDIAQEVIEAFGRFENLCPHLHLPLQSGSNRILKAMGRRYSREHYLHIIEELRKVRPEIVLTTDLIVGFPGENEEDFELTMQAVQEVEFDSSYSFKYSDRPGVRAESMQPKIPDFIKADRLQRLQALQDDLIRKSLLSMEGKDFPVLVEGPNGRSPSKASAWRGRDPGGRVVNLVSRNTDDLSGKLVLTKIMEAKKHSASGEVVGEPW